VPIGRRETNSLSDAADRLEMITGENWEDFVNAPCAVLMLAKSDCEACQAWTQDLRDFLSVDSPWPKVRFGKMLLDKPGLGRFKRQNAWLSEVHDLPFSVIYQKGERIKSFVGGGRERLENRLIQLIQPT